MNLKDLRFHSLEICEKRFIILGASRVLLCVSKEEKKNIAAESSHLLGGKQKTSRRIRHKICTFLAGERSRDRTFNVKWIRRKRRGDALRNDWLVSLFLQIFREKLLRKWRNSKRSNFRIKRVAVIYAASIMKGALFSLCGPNAIINSG